MIFSVLFAGLVIYLVLVNPWWGTRGYRKLERERSRPLFIRMMSWWIGELWALAAVALLLVALSPELDLARIGLVAPGDSATLTGMIVGIVVFGGIAILMAKKGVVPPGQAVFSALIPRDRTERWYALALAISAGVCEEILYRGVLIAVGVHVFGLPLPAAAGLALALFTIGHLYQGPRGMIMVALAGFGLTMIYQRTGSLVPAILLHILIDIRGLLLTPAAKTSGAARTATVQG